MIGASHHRLGGDRLAAGAGRFVADVSVDGMLHAAVVRSVHAHARLVSVDATRALARPGVRAVIVGADVPDAAVIPNRVGAPAGVPCLAQGAARAPWCPRGHARCSVLDPPVPPGFDAPAGVQRAAQGFHCAAGESGATVS